MQNALLLIGYFGYGNLGDEETLRVFAGRLHACGIPYRVLRGGKPSKSARGTRASAKKTRAGKKTQAAAESSANAEAQGAKEAAQGAAEKPLAGAKFASAEGEADAPPMQGGGDLSSSETVVWRRNLPSLRRALRSCRGVVLVGGNLLQSESSVRSLLYYTALLRYAAGQGKPLYLFGGGLGGFRGGISEKIMQKLLPKFSYLGLRSDGDVSAASRFKAIKCKLYFAPDPCFCLPQGKSLKKRTVVFIPRYAAEGDPWFARCLSLSRACGYRVEIAVFFPREDGAALSRLAEAVGARIFFPDTYEEFSRIAATAEFTVSERFHGGIFSLLSHAVCYLRTASEKCEGLCKTANELAPDSGLLLPFRNYQDLVPLLQSALSSPRSQPKPTAADFSRVIAPLRKKEDEEFTKLLRTLRAN